MYRPHLPNNIDELNQLYARFDIQNFKEQEKLIRMLNEKGDAWIILTEKEVIILSRLNARKYLWQHS